LDDYLLLEGFLSENRDGLNRREPNSARQCSGSGFCFISQGKSRGDQESQRTLIAPEIPSLESIRLRGVSSNKKWQHQTGDFDRKQHTAKLKPFVYVQS
jgi:hypothetical protein